MKVAKVKSDEYMVLNMFMDGDEVMRIHYLTPRKTWSPWKSDAKIFYSQGDATSALILKRTEGNNDTTSENKPESIPEKKVEKQSRSEF